MPVRRKGDSAVSLFRLTPRLRLLPPLDEQRELLELLSEDPRFERELDYAPAEVTWFDPARTPPDQAA